MQSRVPWYASHGFKSHHGESSCLRACFLHAQYAFLGPPQDDVHFGAHTLTRGSVAAN